MGWWIGLGVLILLAGLLGAACVRAALLKNPEKRGERQPVDGEKAAKYAKDLSRMIRCETISVRESGPAEKFARYRAELEQLFPLVHERLERTLIGDAMLFKWRGTDPARGAVVLMAHSDVVPAAGEWVPALCRGNRGTAVSGAGELWTPRGRCAHCSTRWRSCWPRDSRRPATCISPAPTTRRSWGIGAPNTVTWLTDHGVKLDLVLDEGGAVIEAPMPG